MRGARRGRDSPRLQGACVLWGQCSQECRPPAGRWSGRQTPHISYTFWGARGLACKVTVLFYRNRTLHTPGSGAAVTGQPLRAVAPARPGRTLAPNPGWTWGRPSVPSPPESEAPAPRGTEHLGSQLAARPSLRGPLVTQRDRAHSPASKGLSW